MNLNKDEWFIAITFGVLIDADHLFAAPRYISDNGLAAILRPSWDDASGLPWKSLFHDPIGVFIVAPLSIGWRFLLPLVFWGMHVAADELQAATLDQSAIVESAMLCAVIVAIVFVTYSRWRALAPKPGLRCFFEHSWAEAKAWFSKFGSST